ncbi:MAG TPA: metallophosphoesterase [Bryobacteraceae bacterium]|nr:metallophosphoesterase [Bryobacteraceae bacterium]
MLKGWERMPFVFRILPVFLLFIGGQVYWILKVRAWSGRWIQGRAARWGSGIAALALYLLLFAANILSARDIHEATRMTLRDAVVVAPFRWWIFSSTLSFAVVVVIWLLRLPVTGVIAAVRLAKRAPADRDLPSPARRQFLDTATTAVAAMPFLGGAYGLLWGRLNLEITRQPIHLAKLPRAFHGFRIAQLSDIHVGPFMTEDEIRKYANIANSLKVDMVALTGDFVTWDAATEQAVVRALSGLRASYGVYGCLGNHDAWADAEDSISALFRECGIHILRGANVPIQSGGESFNLLGIDFANSRGMSAGDGHMSSLHLEGIEKLMAPGMANILLSHNPETFPRAAELGIDLSLAGHTHGGQLALEFISPEIAPTRLVTPYVAGRFERPGGQLYVNRGIGTIAAPMRVGAPPEITVYELLRA